MKNKNYITQIEVEQFELLDLLLQGTYKEFQELSKKKPESPLNTYKAKMVNRILKPIKELLKDEIILDYLDILDTDDIPTNSDVILILSHYLKAMKLFKDKYSQFDISKRTYVWNAK